MCLKKHSLLNKTQLVLQGNYGSGDCMGWDTSAIQTGCTSDGCSLAVKGIKNKRQPTSASAPDPHSKTMSHVAETMPHTQPNTLYRITIIIACS